MTIEVLGSGGAVNTPKIFCDCNSCTQARKYGGVYRRLGPSVVIHGPDMLRSTLGDISLQKKS